MPNQNTQRMNETERGKNRERKTPREQRCDRIKETSFSVRSITNAGTLTSAVKRGEGRVARMQEKEKKKKRKKEKKREYGRDAIIAGVGAENAVCGWVA